MTYITKYSWHPVYSQNNIDLIKKFEECMRYLNEFRKILSIYSVDFPRNYIEYDSQIYEVSIFNKYDPTNHVEIFSWIPNEVYNNIYPKNEIINELSNFGWIINIIYV